MAAGDVFADMYTSVAAGALVSIQPASGVQVCITWIGASNSAYGRIRFRNSSGSYEMSAHTSGSSISYSTAVRRMSGIMNMKCFVTNSEWIDLSSASGTIYMAYSGIEI